MIAGHPIVFDAPDAMKLAPAEGASWHAEMSALRLRVKPSDNLTAIFSMLITGHLPNGIDWDHGDGFPNLPFCKGSKGGPARYIMCCGHTLTPKRALQLVTAGLLEQGPPDRFRRPTLVITPAGRRWALLNWRQSF
jgi:hypothetical protein